jgi:hypothetical protein
VVFLALKHSVYDTDAHFKIDPITRTIKCEAPSKTVLIQGDHNSERFTFELARMIDGHDMSLCDVVQVHYINIDSRDKNLVSKDAHDLDDLQISPDSDDVVICSWLIDGNATKYAGTLNFLIKFKCIGDDGNPCYVWNTATSSNITISSGIDNGEYITVEYSDILELWRHELIEAGSTVSDEQIAQAVEDYFAEHPGSGGNVEDGFSPIAKVEQTATGAVVSITDKTGTTTATITNGKDGQDGKDYVLTSDDKTEIAEMAAELVDVPDSSGGGIHIGPDAPTDENVTVWVDTDEEAEVPSGGGINVTAEVGQTVIVKAVDENGKPTEWEAVDFPEAATPDWNAAEGQSGHVLNRTHYYIGTENQTLLDKTITVASNQFMEYEIVPLLEGNTYTVTWDGVAHTCVAFPMVYNSAPAVALGNPVIFGTGENNDMPFVFLSNESFGVCGGAALTDGEHTIKITEEVKVYQKLDAHYMPDGFLPYTLSVLEMDFVDGAPTVTSTHIGSAATNKIADTLWNGGRVVLNFSGSPIASEGFLKAEVLSWAYADGYIWLTYCYKTNLYQLEVGYAEWTPPTS